MESIAREWEKWLKGSQPTISVTFDQEAAAENPKTLHLTVVHPLVRQAAHHLEIVEPQYCSLTIESSDLPKGVHHFANYRWVMHGVMLEKRLLTLLQRASDEKDGMRPWGAMMTPLTCVIMRNGQKRKPIIFPTIARSWNTEFRA